MKKLLLFVCLLALLAGCSKKEEPAPTPEPTPTVKISVLPTEINSTAEGGTFEIVVSSTLSWIVTSDQSWAVPSVSAGVNNGKFNIAVTPNTAKKEDVATVKITTTESDVATVTIRRAGFIPTIPEKCKASDYAQVTIGKQTWMAENYRCSTYDTKSEAYNAPWLTNNAIPSANNYSFTPYYTDATDKSEWSSTEYAGNLTDAQVAKLGYLYNWAAAVGVVDGLQYNIAFIGNRQGVCPNGWHIPTKAEWQTLYDYIQSDQHVPSVSNEAGKHLKTTSGWFNNGNGTDTYGFAALPAGYFLTNATREIGVKAYFWTVTPDESNSILAFYCNLHYDDKTFQFEENGKEYRLSVRCVKN